MKHTDQCNAHQAAVDTFWEKHPSACRSCGGAGGKHTCGSMYEPPGYDLCGCVEGGHCPLCAQGLEMFEVEGNLWSRCTVCDWNEYKIHTKLQKAEICPDVDCFCWEDPINQSE